MGALAAAATIDAITATDRSQTMTKLEACQLLVDLLRQLAATQGEREIYREIVSVALTQLHQKDIELKQERDARFRLIEEYRALRGRPCR